MSAFQSASIVLAILFLVAGASLSVSVASIPASPRFRMARRQVALLAAASLAGSVALTFWVLVP